MNNKGTKVLKELLKEVKSMSIEEYIRLFNSIDASKLKERFII
jgi:hypothetical protein